MAFPNTQVRVSVALAAFAVDGRAALTCRCAGGRLVYPLERRPKPTGTEDVAHRLGNRSRTSSHLHRNASPGHRRWSGKMELCIGRQKEGGADERFTSGSYHARDLGP